MITNLRRSDKYTARAKNYTDVYSYAKVRLRFVLVHLADIDASSVSFWVSLHHFLRSFLVSDRSQVWLVLHDFQSVELQRNVHHFLLG